VLLVLALAFALLRATIADDPNPKARPLQSDVTSAFQGPEFTREAIVYEEPSPTVEPTPTPTDTPVPPTPTLPPPPPPPVRAAASTPVPAPPVSADRASILAIIGSYSWNFDEAVAVAVCESGLNPNARNPSGATGLFQIIGGNPAMFDPATNVAAAWAKYQDGVRRGNRWYHWNQFGSCGHFY
jgi:hypothetical protein